MDSLRVAVIVEENCLPSEGGGYSYYQALIKQLDTYLFPKEIELTFLLPASAVNGYPFTKSTIIEKRNTFDRISYALLHKLYRFTHWLFPRRSKNALNAISRILSGISNRNAEASLKQHNIDLAYYIKPNDNPMDYPMIVTHWDVGHKSMYPFPEVAEKANYLKREAYYNNMLNKAMLILCESESGVEELLHYYPVNKEKVKVLPLFAGEIIHLKVSEKEQNEALARFELQPQQFFIYPAQFWAHKNHFNLVAAFRDLVNRSENQHLKLVFCGADQGNLKYIQHVVASMKLEQHVVFAGFINNRVLYSFYRNAISLVMPTYLGPTNLPLIEAAMLHCPVICSDLKGHREILGDASIYINPASASEITEAMQSMLQEPLRKELIARGYERINVSPFHLQKSMKVLEKILTDIRPVRKAWGNFSKLLQLITYTNIGILNF